MNSKLGLWIGHGGVTQEVYILFFTPSVKRSLWLKQKQCCLRKIQTGLGISTPNLVCGLLLESPRSLLFLDTFLLNS